MTRRSLWRIIGGGLLFSALALAAWVWWEEQRLADDKRMSLVIVAANNTALQRGNGVEFPLRFPDRLPAGVELRVLHERGGWLQVQLAGGEIGWVNGEQLLTVD